MVGFIENLKNKYNLQIQYHYCDIAGENVAFKRYHTQEGLGVDFKYTAPDMPEWNGHVATLFNLQV